jgi:hypothetical protein
MTGAAWSVWIGSVAEQGIEARQASRDDMLRMTERLIADYAGRVPAGGVTQVVARAQEQLRSTGYDDLLVERTEMVARSRLAKRFAAHSAA